MSDTERPRVSFRAPELAQGSDQDAILTIADVMSPGFISRNKQEGGLSLWVDGHLMHDDLAELERGARRRFAECLGVLRAMKFGRGELKDETERSPARDASGAAVVRVGTVKVYRASEDEITEFARRAHTAISASERLRSALVLHGKANRDAADLYNIFEYVEEEFGGREGIRSALGISINKQKAFTASANNLMPLDGGRHLKRANPTAVKMQMEEMAEFVAELLRVWILA